ncbi:MAG: urea carboxylase-associated family protein [Rhodospirillales bacterium]|nr:urea carboxylase-associated family protein [Rhodospirillales bacterium]
MLKSIAQKYHVPARTGRAFEAVKGDLIRITDLEGAQPVDFWAFARDGGLEFLSPEHTKPSIEKLFPRVGDAAYTNRRRAIVTVVEDNSPGQHDMEYAACDPARYRDLGVTGYHASCHENLHAALAKHGIEIPFTPQPWNLFTNFFINPDGTFTIKSPETKAGDNIVLRAEMDALVVVSACPQDQNLTCGGHPTDIQVEVGR